MDENHIRQNTLSMTILAVIFPVTSLTWPWTQSNLHLVLRKPWAQ